MKKEKATIKDFARMCNKNSSKCEECPLALISNSKRMFCDDFIRKYPDKANEIILKWCEEHPVKTRQEKFLEMFPNASVDINGILNVCPNAINKDLKCDIELCEFCRKNYWSEEVEE